MSFFKRSGIYNLDCFGRVGYKNDVKTVKKNMGTHVFMQASDCVINYLNKNKFLLRYLQSILFCTFTTFICLGEIGFLGYKVGKLIFFSVCV